MKLIGENIHIISKSVREAILARDTEFIKKLIFTQMNAGMDWIDLNIGPAKKNLEGTMEWLVGLVKELTTIPVSLDSSNILEIENGLKNLNEAKKCLINSTSADVEKLDTLTDLAIKFDASLICLTMNKELGIPKFADERLALAFEIVETANSKGIENERLYFDPLILPLSVEQSQAIEALNSIRMFKESFEPQVRTTIGLSNVSNGAPKELRPLINRVFFVLAYGCGLDSAIVDANDSELLRLNKVLETQFIEKNSDKLILDLADAMRNFDDIENIEFDKCDEEQIRIYKTSEIILNKKVYTHSYLEI